ncbi:MAG: hypothetical protein II365_03790, partial [Clostridia bacterium]|nr:hypothetical protein [Clostridia bacterium]
MSVGASGTEICLLHPLETAYGYFRGLIDPTDESPRAAVDDYDEMYYRLIVQLYSTQTAFHFVDPSTLDDMGETDGTQLRVGAMRYSAIVIADIEVLSQKTFVLLKEFARSGGKIYVKGKLPSRLDGVLYETLADELATLDGAHFFETNEELIRALRKTACTYKYECEGDSSRTVINHRALENENYFFIHNGDCRKEKRAKLIVDGIHSAFSFNAHTGEITELPVLYRDDKTEISFTNAIGGSSAIFTKSGRREVANLCGAYITIPSDSVCYEVKEKNLLTLEICTYKTEEMRGFTSKPIAVERVTERLKQEQYKGMVTLRFTFESDFAAKGLCLVAEDTKDCEIMFNGSLVDRDVIGNYSNTEAFEILKLPDVTQIGKNVIEITRYTEPPLATRPSDDMKHLFELFRSPEGVDLERIHLLGDFLVDAIPEYTQASGLDRFAKGFVITDRNPCGKGEDITTKGYPFYPGPVEYLFRFHLDVDPSIYSCAVLKIGRYNGCSATVSIGGKTLGYIDREPYELTIKSDVLRVGENEIKTKLLGSFRNMFGPSHFLDYDPAGCS